MIKPFCNSSLFDICLKKLKKSKAIPKENIIVSVHEPELKKIAIDNNIKIFNRSNESANNDNDLKTIYEWYNKIPYKYVVLVSACNPLLKIQTIDNFFNHYISSDADGLFGVFEKKTYYWDQSGNSLTNWNPGQKIMNTKVVNPVYEAGHCLYASCLEIIDNGFWMDKNIPPKPKLFKLNELECFDIDYEWQFNICEKIYSTTNI
jgi:CMP-N-acetylneuraminic acid synthetase